MARSGRKPGVRGDDLLRAAGGLLWRQAGRRHLLAVIHRPTHRDWSLPKGKLERGETFPEAAVREVLEETRCQVRLHAFAGYTLYEVRGRPKVVLFWHMSVERFVDFAPNAEVDRLDWLTPSEAMRRLDYPAERRLVETALLEGWPAAGQ